MKRWWRVAKAAIDREEGGKEGLEDKGSGEKKSTLANHFEENIEYKERKYINLSTGRTTDKGRL